MKERGQKVENVGGIKIGKEKKLSETPILPTSSTILPAPGFEIGTAMMVSRRASD